MVDLDWMAIRLEFGASNTVTVVFTRNKEGTSKFKNLKMDNVTFLSIARS